MRRIKGERWRTIPGHSNYKISNKGRVQSKLNGLLNPRCSDWKKKTGSAYYLYDDNKKGHMWTIQRWLALTWPEVSIEFTEEYKEYIIEVNNLASKKQKQMSVHGEIPPNRKCRVCGVPTFNYWCDTCRREIRSNYVGSGPVETYKTAYGS